MASTFPPPPAGARLARPARRESTGIASLAEIMADVSSPSASHGADTTPRAPQSHFFPSVSRAQRDLARQARLAAASPEPVTSSTPPAPSPPPPEHHQLGPGKIRGIEALLSAAGGAGHAGGGGPGEQDDVRRDRGRERHELGPSGPFAARRPSYASSQHSFVSAAPSKAASADDDDDERRGVGAGGSGGTKRRRDVDRTGWDAASDLMRDDDDEMDERHGEGSRRDRGGADREKTPTPNLGRAHDPAVGGRGVSFHHGDGPSRSRYDSSASPGVSPGASSKPGSVASVDRDDDAVMDDDASIMTSRTGATTGAMADDDDDGKEPAKKRSRTLTTPAQTAVLNALLAKTRFPSTETREEVGKQIGMSARRVQIWFQNRRQSQKRQRDREAQEAVAASAAQAAAMAAGHHHAVYGAHPQMAYGVDSYGRPAHFYQAVQHKPPGPMHAGYPPRPGVPRHPSMESLSSTRSGYAPSQRSMHSLHGRETMAPHPSDQRHAHPYANSGAAAYAAYGQQQQQQQHPSAYPPHLQSQQTAQYLQHQHQQHQQAHLLPPKLYFPSIPRSHAPSGRVVADPYRPPPPQPMSPSAPTHGAGPDGRLPSLSSVLQNGAPSAAEPAPHAAMHASSAAGQQPMFSHSPFSPSTPAYQSMPQVGAAARPQGPAPPTFARSLFSPEPSSSFERLRISGGPMSPVADAAPPPFPSSSSTTSSATPTPTLERGQQDVLDVAMDRMAYRSRGGALPARQTLPPLRAVFGDPVINSSRAKKGGPSEADKALLAPIRVGSLSSAPGSADGPPRLAPISTFAPLAANSSSPVSPHRQVALPSPGALSPHNAAGVPPTSRASTWSDASHATRSSAASFEFGAPPPGSYRSERSSLAHGGGSTERPLPPAPLEAGEPKGGRGEGEGSDGSVETHETSAAPSVSSEGGAGVKA
ncbi:hypothetical protein JCM3775_004663 [Rhodotorula graminis]